MREQIHNYITEHKDEIVSTLKELVKIPSVRGESKSDAPFGKACADVLEYTQWLYRENGFETDLNQNDGYLLSYYGEGRKTLGIFAHADVVPVGDDWVLTKPFVPIEKDGFLIGRGVLDDKSAIIISLYCMKMLKELNIPFNSRLVMFTGVNEETGMADMDSYVKSHKSPDFSIIADSAFPLYRGDKGILRFTAISDEKLKDITEFRGGTAFNIILGEATAKVGDLTFSEKGISSHGAQPEGSVNAAYLLSKKLSENNELCQSDKEQMLFISNTLENYYGEVFGVENNDFVFGRLTCSNGIVGMNDGKVSLSFDMRYGMNVDIEDVKDKVEKYFRQNNWSIEFVYQSQPYLTSEDNPYLQACLMAYTQFTGAENPDIRVNAGATYAIKLPCAVEVGTQMWGGIPDGILQGHGGAHQPDEYISIDGLLEAIEIVMMMLIECDKVNEV